MDAKLLIDELLEFIDKRISEIEAIHPRDRHKREGLFLQLVTGRVLKKVTLDTLSREDMTDKQKAKEIALYLYGGILSCCTDMLPEGEKKINKNKKISKSLRSKTYETDSKQSRYSNRMDILIKTGLTIDQAHPIASLQVEGLNKNYARECKRRYKNLRIE